MYRPKLKLKKTKLEWFSDLIGAGIFIGVLVYMLSLWNELPDLVPVHFNAAGEADRWEAKSTLIVLPLIAIFTWVFMTILERFPHIHNYPKRLNETNVRAFYLSSRKMLNVSKNICMLLFSYIVFQQVNIARTTTDTIHPLFPVVFFAALAVPVLIHLIE